MFIFLSFLICLFRHFIFMLLLLLLLFIYLFDIHADAISLPLRCHADYFHCCAITRCCCFLMLCHTYAMLLLRLRDGFMPFDIATAY